VKRASVSVALLLAFPTGARPSAEQAPAATSIVACRSVKSIGVPSMRTLGASVPPRNMSVT